MWRRTEPDSHSYAARDSCGDIVADSLDTLPQADGDPHSGIADGNTGIHADADLDPDGGTAHDTRYIHRHANRDPHNGIADGNGGIHADACSQPTPHRRRVRAVVCRLTAHAGERRHPR